MNSDSVHMSKVDTWLAAIVAGSLSLGLISILAAVAAKPKEMGWIALFYVGVLVFVGLLAVPMRYTVRDREVDVQSGVLHWNIQIDAIVEAYPTRNPLSSPAWSLDRLAIRFMVGGNSREIMISPADKTAFMTDLSERDPKLIMQGDRLVRAG